MALSIWENQGGAGDSIQACDPIITNFAVRVLDVIGQSRPPLGKALRLLVYFRWRSWMVWDRTEERLTYIPY